MNMNLPKAVFRCDLLKLGATPANEIMISTHATILDAMNEAERLKRLDPAHSYIVGDRPDAN